jgi:hypothetical protein
MNKFSRNPFDRTILQDDKLFSGKSHLRVLKSIRKELNYQRNNGSCRSFIIKGDRGTGKSSILKILSNEVTKYNFIPIQIYLTENITNEISFFQSLYNGIFKLCKDSDILIDEISKAEISVVKTEIVEDSRFWVFEFINKLIEFKLSNNSSSNLISDDVLKDFKLIITNIRESNKFDSNTKIAFLVDESQLIFSNSAALSILRHILQENIGVTFFFAGQNQMTDNKSIDVFDNLNRNFHVHDLDYFEDIHDVKEFFDKSFESIGWKESDIRVYVNNYNSLVKSIYFLTNGKPEFINRIADSMFRRVIERVDNKLRLNEDVLMKITNDLEKSESDRNGFSISRAQKILRLNDIEFEWFSLFCKSILQKPKDIYEYFSIFFEGFKDIEDFQKMVYHWGKDGLLDFLRARKDGDHQNLISVDLSKEEVTPKEIIDLEFVYPGSPVEREWLIIKLSQSGKSILFNSRGLITNLLWKIAGTAGYNGTPRTFDISLKNKIFNSSFYTDGSTENNSMTDLFNAAKNKKLKLPQENIHWQVDFLFDFLNSKSLISYAQFFYLSIKINNDYRIFCSYIFEKRDSNEISKINEELDKMRIRLYEKTSIEMNYKFEELFEHNFCTYSDFENAVLNSDNDEAKLSLLSKSNLKAIELYLDNKDSNHEDIVKWNQVILIGIQNNLNVAIQLANNAGYMYMNIFENDKAKLCFEYVLNNESKINGITNDDFDDSSIFLSTYNLAILKVKSEEFNSALELFKDCESLYYEMKDVEFAALNYLEKENDTIIVKEETKSKKIDSLQLIELNIQLLSDLLL